MKQYLDLMQRILEQGTTKGDRTGTGTLSLFGPQLEFDLADGFPLVTTKKLHTKAIIHELLWFLRGDTNIGYLNANKVSIWNEWADEQGELGPVYGHQWRHWGARERVSGLHPPYTDLHSFDTYQAWDYPGIDQIKQLIDEIKTQPDSRRMLVSAWNVEDIPKMALPPCHCLFQFNVAAGRLSCKLYQRSADYFIGVPFNIASYALLTLMVAQVTGLEPGRLIHTFGDCHLYLNHIEQARLQLAREPLPLPVLQLNPDVKSIDEFGFLDFQLIGYHSHPHIAAPIAV